jgi:serine/threonine protein kinase
MELAMNTPQFIVIAGPDIGSKFNIIPGTGKLLGRHADAAYSLKDPRISRFHCDIQSEDGKVTVVDQGGSGGVMVNGVKVARVALKHGDVVQVGDTQLRFDIGATSEGETLRGSPTANAEYDPKATEQLAELSGRELSHFKLGVVLGKGVASVVFRATNTTDGKDVALKVMQPAFARHEDEMHRFVRAVKTMLPLRHPNLVTLLGAGKSGPYCWVSMELVEGESLTQVIARIGVAGMLDWKHAFRAALHVGRALEYAHAQGIIHRDIAPANILVRSEDKLVKLGDLMLAKALEGTLAEQVTKPGEVVGDVNYMSPERTKGAGEPVDGRSDLFSLGATCYALLTGKPPFKGKTLVETITNIRNVEPVAPGTFQIGIPSSFEGAILKLLAKHPDNRYSSAGELVKDLERIGRLSGAPV